jgi:RNA polymerase sigma-70 factor (ECF subfamily)
MLRKQKEEDNLDETLPEKESDHTEQLVVSEAVMSLPLQFREIVILYYYREFTMKEIAEITNTKIPNIEYRIRRAKELLRERLGDDFCD